MAEIEGTEFGLWWDVDRTKLKGLSFVGRVEWLRKRMERVLLKPLEALEAREHEMFVWLAVTELLCAGIEALGGFYGCTYQRGKKSKQSSSFCRFIDSFMDQGFSQTAKSAEGKNWTYGEHLEKYFRSGLDHGFSTEWGGLWIDGENGLPGYLRPARDGNGIAVAPRALLLDFRQAVNKYFDQLAKDGEKSLIGRNFQGRFNGILQHKGRTR